MKFGDKLKTLRLAQRLTQKQLADRLGISKSIISYYESGEKYPSYDIIVKIAQIFRTTTDYLLDIERKRLLDVSDLSENEIAVITMVADALKNKTE